MILLLTAILIFYRQILKVILPEYSLTCYIPPVLISFFLH